MQCSFGTLPSGNDETVCLVDTVESHVPEEDDARNVDIRIGRASNASEPSLQAMARADWDSSSQNKSWLSRTISFTPIPVRSCHQLTPLRDRVVRWSPMEAAHDDRLALRAILGSGELVVKLLWFVGKPCTN